MFKKLSDSSLTRIVVQTPTEQQKGPIPLKFAPP